MSKKIYWSVEKEKMSINKPLKTKSLSSLKINQKEKVKWTNDYHRTDAIIDIHYIVN